MIKLGLFLHKGSAMLKKTFNIVLLIIAAIILVIYMTGYNYLFTALRLTYLRGKNSSSIDDGKYFPANLILKGNPKPWPLASDYNRKPLPAKLNKHLQETETVSFVAIQHGQIIQEHYWDNYSRNTANNSFSMAKTITVLLLGKAIDDGRISSADAHFSDFYPEFSRKKHAQNLTLRDLATMQAGLDWKEDYKNPFLPNAKAYYGSALADVVFSTNFKENPGQHFEYQSGATQLLGFAIGKSLGEPLSSYASAKLWKPLGMEHNAKWTTDDLSVEKSFCCIESNARDWAKIGLLLINDGKFDGVPLISPSFVNQMTTPAEHSGGAYGMGLWINNDTRVKHYYLRGLYGQYVIVVPQYDLIIVRMGNRDNPAKDEKNRPREVEFYINEILKIADTNQSAS